MTKDEIAELMQDVPEGCLLADVQQEGQIAYFDENMHLHVATVNKEPSLTQQHQSQEADINYIMREFSKNPMYIQQFQQKQGIYADFSSGEDLHQMMNIIQQAKDTFMLLPAEARAKFNNDPSKLIDYLKDDKNYDESCKLGLRIRDPNRPQNPQTTPQTTTSTTTTPQTPQTPQ